MTDWTKAEAYTEDKPHLVKRRTITIDIVIKKDSTGRYVASAIPRKDEK